MAALVSHDPQPSAEETLQDSVSSPEHGAEGHRGDRLGGHVVVEQVEGSGEQGDVAGNVAQTTKGGAFEAVLGNGIAQLLDGVVGDNEFVAVCVEKLSVSLLGLWLLVQRGKRGVGG